jgi:ketosteroid isomerase-like protein
MNADRSEKDAIEKVVSGYYDAFGRDSAAAAAFFGEPTLIVSPDQVLVLRSRAEIEATFDKFVASLKPGGFSHSKLGDHRVKLLNAATALYSTVVIRMKADGTEWEGPASFICFTRPVPDGEFTKLSSPISIS